MIEFKCSSYNENSGESSVTIITDLGEFTGKARVHPEDLDNKSDFFGCKIAEARATVSYIKSRIKILNIKIKSVKSLYNSLKNLKEFDERSIYSRKIRKNIYLLEKEKKVWDKRLNNNLLGLKQAIEQRDKEMERRRKGDK